MSYTTRWVESEKRFVTSLTVLQCLQAAVDFQLEELAKNHPNRRVAVVFFSDEVIDLLYIKAIRTPVRICLCSYDVTNEVTCHFRDLNISDFFPLKISVSDVVKICNGVIR